MVAVAGDLTGAGQSESYKDECCTFSYQMEK